MRTRLFLIFLWLIPALSFAGTLDKLDSQKMKTIWDKKAFRALSPTLDDAAFDLKWNGAMKTPLALMRAFERQYYLDLLPFANLGPVGLCHGDAHFDNFGFLRTRMGKTVFAINDLDDSGYCPVAIDVLRFLVSVRLSPQDEKLVPDLAAVYAHIVNHELRREEFLALPPEFFPTDAAFVKESAKTLEENTANDKFVLGERLSGLKGITIEEVRTALQKSNPHLNALDVAEYSKPTGGSAGLKRYWVLVGQNSYREILELKLAAEPAVGVKNWGADLPDLKPRIESVAAVFFRGLNIPFYQTISLRNQEFLLRSRAKASFEWDSQSPEARTRAYAQEIAILARLHQASWKDREQLQELRNWLIESSEVVAQRMRDNYRALKAVGRPKE